MRTPKANLALASFPLSDLLAEKVIMPRLLNATIDLIHSVSLRGTLIDTHSLAYIYDNTAVGSLFRKLFV